MTTTTLMLILTTTKGINLKTHKYAGCCNALLLSRVIYVEFVNKQETLFNEN